MDVGFCWISKLNRSLFGFFSHPFRSAYLPTTHLLNADNKGWGQKKKSQKLAGGQGPVTDCVAQNKKHLVPYRKRERGESTRILQPKSRTTLYVWMCVCAWMTILLYYNLLTTDYLAPQAGDWRWGARAPCCVHVCFFYKVVSILSKEYADDMLRAVILIQVSV